MEKMPMVAIKQAIEQLFDDAAASLFLTTGSGLIRCPENQAGKDGRGNWSKEVKNDRGN